MIITVRLYRRYDMDLIHLSNYDDFSVVKTAKACLVAYAKGEAYKYRRPTGKYTNSFDSTYRYSITLNEKSEDEKKVIDLLSCIKGYHKNAFIKNLIRGYLLFPALEAYIGKPKAEPEEEAKYIKVRDEIIPAGYRAFERITDSSVLASTPHKNKKAVSLSDKTRKQSKDKDPEIAENKPSRKKKTANEAFGNVFLAKKDGDDEFVNQIISSLEKIKSEDPKAESNKSLEGVAKSVKTKEESAISETKEGSFSKIQEEKSVSDNSSLEESRLDDIIEEAENELPQKDIAQVVQPEVSEILPPPIELPPAIKDISKAVAEGNPAPVSKEENGAAGFDLFGAFSKMVQEY